MGLVNINEQTLNPWMSGLSDCYWVGDCTFKVIPRESETEAL